MAILTVLYLAMMILSYINAFITIEENNDSTFGWMCSFVGWGCALINYI